ncbi:MAG: L-idonate 5-dehydrogenase [Rhodospirillaceae bacterium]|nr:L-idonate 5-dehydrogenase [Rhodospirillaceae bacterium]|tara:strand:- start:3580 stop:4617 length:1038 start_codon:yes stop_codon:yes gene_type:complete
MRAAVLTGKGLIETLNREPKELGPTDIRIRIRAGGICGSDLHYFHHYRMGDFPVREPFVLGHEAAGIVEALGSGVTDFEIGDLVTINPSHPCHECYYCLTGRELLCAQMRFLGSSRKFPHIQGVFSEIFETDQSQCFKLPREISLNVAAFAEPLAVALHAISHAGSMIGGDVLISGSGPIGCLILIATKLAGANSVTMTDIKTAPLHMAEQLGANQVIDVSKNTTRLYKDSAAKGSFDIAFDASGSEKAVLAAIKNLRPGGTFIQVGTFIEPNISIPTDQIMVKELIFRSSFRFDKEFAWAVNYLAKGRVDVEPLLSHTFPMEDANEAFRVASDRNKSMKVHLIF